MVGVNHHPHLHSPHQLWHLYWDWEEDLHLKVSISLASPAPLITAFPDVWMLLSWIIIMIHQKTWVQGIMVMMHLLSTNVVWRDTHTLHNMSIINELFAVVNNLYNMIITSIYDERCADVLYVVRVWINIEWLNMIFLLLSPFVSSLHLIFFCCMSSSSTFWCNLWSHQHPHD